MFVGAIKWVSERYLELTISYRNRNNLRWRDQWSLRPAQFNDLGRPAWGMMVTDDGHVSEAHGQSVIRFTYGPDSAETIV